MRTPKPKKTWALYNMATLFYVGRTARECRQEAECITGDKWAECKKYMQVRKVLVSVIEEAK